MRRKYSQALDTNSYTVKPLLTTPPRSNQPPNTDQVTRPQLITPHRTNIANYNFREETDP